MTDNTFYLILQTCLITWSNKTVTVCMHYPFCLKKDHLGSNRAMWWTRVHHFSHQHHHRRALNEYSVYTKKETPHKLRSLLTKQYLSVLWTRASRKPKSDMRVWDYVLSLHVAEPLGRGLPYRLWTLWNLFRAILSVKTYSVSVLSSCPEHLLPTCQLPCMGLLAVLFSGLELTFQAQGGLWTREGEDT